MPEEVARLLVLSDLHVGSMADSLSPTLVDCHNPLVRDDSRLQHLVSVLQEQNANPTHLLVLGDLTSTGEPAEFKRASEAVDFLASELDIKQHNVVTLVGNHDVNWRISRLADVDISGSEVLPRQLSQREDGYKSLAIQLQSSLTRTPRGCKPSQFPVSGYVEYDGLDIIFLNSTLACIHDVRPQHGDVTLDQLNWLECTLQGLETDPDRYRIVLVHHHVRQFTFPTAEKDFSPMQHADRLFQICGKHKVDLILHGHRHHSFLYTFKETGFDKPCTIFSAGSFSVGPHHRTNGGIPNLAHLVTLYKKPSNKIGLGKINSLRFAPTKKWVFASSDEEAGTTPEVWFHEPYGADDLKSRIIHEIDNAVNGVMPLYQNLPVQLRSVPLHHLNNILRDTTLAHCGLKLSGGYSYSSGTFVGQPVILREE